jgi:hypothetical protein
MVRSEPRRTPPSGSTRRSTYTAKRIAAMASSSVLARSSSGVAGGAPQRRSAILALHTSASASSGPATRSKPPSPNFHRGRSRAARPARSRCDASHPSPRHATSVAASIHSDREAACVMKPSIRRSSSVMARSL